MAFKYQVFLCPRPKDLLLISYNHIDTIRELVKDTPVVVNQVDETQRKIIEVYLELLVNHISLLNTKVQIQVCYISPQDTVVHTVCTVT